LAPASPIGRWILLRAVGGKAIPVAGRTPRHARTPVARFNCSVEDRERGRERDSRRGRERERQRERDTARGGEREGGGERDRHRARGRDSQM